MTRWKASAVHLSLSVAVLGLIAAILIWRWYPPGLFHMARADRLFYTIAGVDVTLGPLLTLIVYKQGKKYLKLDLSVIALLQIAAMAYGLHAIWQSRPVYLVAVVDRFALVFANEIDPKDLRAAPERFRSLPWLGPQTVAAPLPEDQAKRQDLMFQTLASGTDLEVLPQHYVPYGDAAEALLGRALSAAEFAKRLSPANAVKFTAAVEGLSRSDLSVLPISSSRGDATMILDATDGRPLKPVAVDPWPVFNVLMKDSSPSIREGKSR